MSRRLMFCFNGSTGSFLLTSSFLFFLILYIEGQTSEVPNIDNIFRHDVDLHLTSCILVSKILFHISVSNLFFFILSLFCSVEKISLQIFKLLKTNNKPSMLFWLHVTGNNNLTSWFNIWNRKLPSELKHIACDTPTPFTKYF